MDKTLKIETNKTFPLRSYTPLQLCALYEVSKKTFLKWIKPFQTEIGRREGHYYNINQVVTILEKLGLPGRCVID
jgi:hypothetical protein